MLLDPKKVSNFLWPYHRKLRLLIRKLASQVALFVGSPEKGILNHLAYAF
jgi:hypothetical protein